jgi:hypothetical protein
MATGRTIKRGSGFEQTVERSVHLGSCSRLGRTRMEPAKRPKPEQAEYEEGYEQEQKHMMKGRLDPLNLK